MSRVIYLKLQAHREKQETTTDSKKNKREVEVLTQEYDTRKKTANVTKQKKRRCVYKRTAM